MISVVVPFYNEQDSLEKLVTSLIANLNQTGNPYEVVLVDDGSSDTSLTVARKLLDLHTCIVLLSLRRNHGKSAALAVGMEKAVGEIVVTMDADFQDDPADISKFLDALETCDLVCGWRKPRRDSLHKRLQSLLYNYALKVTGFHAVHDINCGFKAMRREVARDIPLYGERHRLIPLVAAWQGFRVGEVVVNHKPRKKGKSKYGVSRFPNAVFDILTAFLLSRFYRQFFSCIGVLSTLAGLIICSYTTYVKIATGSFQYHYPLLTLGVMLLALGIQLLFVSFLSELIVYRHRKPGRDYLAKLIIKSSTENNQPSEGK